VSHIYKAFYISEYKCNDTEDLNTAFLKIQIMASSSVGSGRVGIIFYLFRRKYSAAHSTNDICNKWIFNDNSNY